MIISLDAIASCLASNDQAVAKAMVVLLSRQTEGEQHAGMTVESNGKGFNAFDADKGTYYAKWVLGVRSNCSPSELRAAIAFYLTGDNHKKGRALTGRFLSHARKMAVKYRRQLAEVAANKAKDATAEWIATFFPAVNAAIAV